MNSSHLRHWLEGIGIFAVVASFVFLGVQIHQEGIISSAQYAYDLLSAKRSELIGLIVDNKSLWIRGLNGELLSKDDAIAFEALAATYFGFEVARYRNRLLVSGDDEFAVVLEMAHIVQTFPGLKDSWRKHLRIRRELHGKPSAFELEVEKTLKEFESGERQPIHIDSFVFM